MKALSRAVRVAAVAATVVLYAGWGLMTFGLEGLPRRVQNGAVLT